MRRDARKDLGRLRLGRPDEPRAGTRATCCTGEDNATVAYDLTAVKPEKVADVRARGRAGRAARSRRCANVYAMEFRDEIALTGELSEVGLPLRQERRLAASGAASSWTWPGGRRKALAVRFTGDLEPEPDRSWTQFYDVYDEAGEWAGSTSRTFQDVEPVLSPPFAGSLMVEGSPLPWLTLGATTRYVAASWLDNTNASGIATPDWWKGAVDSVCSRLFNLSNT
ncbi:MAG: hypothetical protein MZW92_29885 [Comamonadaceae bacterium]|nr:hypothetical protein [Comamonadaceae bacterium]